MSELLTCERGAADAEAFAAQLAHESAELIAQKIPTEYRSAYLSSYAAGLALDQVTRVQTEPLGGL